MSKHQKLASRIQNMDGMLKRASGRSFYNTSRLDFRESVRDTAVTGQLDVTTTSGAA